MIKRTLYFSQPYYLSRRLEQLIIEAPVDKNLPKLVKQADPIPIEDIGLIVLDHPQITITQGLITRLLEHNAAIVHCDDRHLPTALLLPLEGHHTLAERQRVQLASSEPLRKQLWQQVVVAKIKNQAALLQKLNKPHTSLLTYAKNVRSGDPDNYEARAAAYYWAHLFPSDLDFRRGRDELPPNNLLNYGYAILRALVARAIVGAGLLPSQGLHHSNKYNAYALADDLMEPFRPFVDAIVQQIVVGKKPYDTLTKEHKARLMMLPQLDVRIRTERSPLFNATHTVAVSLFRCFESETRKLALPSFTESDTPDLELQLPLT
ncbi:type II CRISPR-associated endonuclease Cas1 [Runella limosa]|uniref:type II CRISPR-associated endonuclease Cas1 n=1 Tax=Runella limosa TaxID=370978 RepID=UPI000424F8E2|nr:type II CRISPR-associated endonuclease Cas1 [Runella limosa]